MLGINKEDGNNSQSISEIIMQKISKEKIEIIWATIKNTKKLKRIAITIGIIVAVIIALKLWKLDRDFSIEIFSPKIDFGFEEINPKTKEIFFEPLFKQMKISGEELSLIANDFLIKKTTIRSFKKIKTPEQLSIKCVNNTYINLENISYKTIPTYVYLHPDKTNFIVKFNLEILNNHERMVNISPPIGLVELKLTAKLFRIIAKKGCKHSFGHEKDKGINTENSHAGLLSKLYTTSHISEKDEVNLIIDDKNDIKIEFSAETVRAISKLIFYDVEPKSALRLYIKKEKKYATILVEKEFLSKPKVKIDGKINNKIEMIIKSNSIYLKMTGKYKLIEIDGFDYKYTLYDCIKDFLIEVLPFI